MCVQSMPDASPAKWHLAHTSWFHEAVVLPRAGLGYRVFDESYSYLFNSYYEALGERHPRPDRGLLTRPTVAEVRAYRQHVDEALAHVVSQADNATWSELAPLLVLGIQHEQQHQELLATDIVHLFSCNPLLPAWQASNPAALKLAPEPQALPRWIGLAPGITSIGHPPADGSSDNFAFDNETPPHQVFIAPYEISDRLVTCGEYLDFIEDGGYNTSSLWLSDGWAAVRANEWKAPAYWLTPDDPRGAFGATSAPTEGWRVFGPHGVRALDAGAPVTQLSFYEAAAYANWACARLPTEHEWEAAFDEPGMREMLGHAWQWTRSSYDPYPGFKALEGAAEEYNGKFMVGQIVLRGSSAWTPEGHARHSYRNFFPPAARWQFSGLRLARNVS